VGGIGGASRGCMSVLVCRGTVSVSEVLRRDVQDSSRDFPLSVDAEIEGWTGWLMMKNV